MEADKTKSMHKLRVRIQYDCSHNDRSSKKMGDVDKEKDIDRKSYTWKDLHSDLHNWAIYDSKQHIIVFKELKMENGEDDLVFGELEKNISVHVIVKDKNNRKPVGLLNEELNCYANSVLQCLKATERFSNYLSGDDYGETCPEKGDLCVSCCLRRYILKDLQSSTAFLPTMILSRLEDLGGDFKEKGLGSQFDAEDFLCAILSKFQPDENIGEPKHPKNTDINEKLFDGTLLTEHVCECGFKKAYETRHFKMLPIPIKLEDQVGFKSLKECMDAFTMKQPSSSLCEGCSLQKKSEETRIVVSPEILIICLGRLVGTGKGSTKLVHDVDCPVDFDFSPYVSGNGRVEQKYELYGVIHHRRDGPNVGHYWCFTKYNGEWYQIDDSRVTSIAKEDVEKKSKTSSIFFYRRKMGEHSEAHGERATEDDIPRRTDADPLLFRPPPDEDTPRLSDKLIKGRFLDPLLDSNQRLIEKYFIIQDRPPSEIIEGIKTKLVGCTEEKHRFIVPELGDTIYDEELQAYCCLRGTGFKTYCSTNKATKAKARKIYEFLTAIQTHFNDTSVDKRGLLYEQTLLYVKKSYQIDGIVDIVCILLQVTRWSIRVSLDAKGLIIGPVVLGVNGSRKIDCSDGKTVLIPHDSHLVNKIMPKIKDIRFILIVEKATIMSKLVSIEFYKTYGCIILSGKGHSDVATRGVEHKLERELRVPVYGIADYNPNGAIAMLTYKNGSRRRGFDNLNVTVPRLQWLGMHSVHCYGNRSGPRTRHQRRPRDSQPLNKREKTTLQNLISDLERDKDLLDPLDVQEVKFMLAHGFRMNFEQRFPLARNIVDFLAEHIPEMATVEKPGVRKRKTAVEKSDGDDSQVGKKSDGDDAQVGKKTRKVTKGKSDGDNTQVGKRPKKATKVQLQGKEAK